MCVAAHHISKPLAQTIPLNMAHAVSIRRWLEMGHFPRHKNDEVFSFSAPPRSRVLPRAVELRAGSRPTFAIAKTTSLCSARPTRGHARLIADRQQPDFLRPQLKDPGREAYLPFCAASRLLCNHLKGRQSNDIFEHREISDTIRMFIRSNGFIPETRSHCDARTKGINAGTTVPRGP